MPGNESFWLTCLMGKISNYIMCNFTTYSIGDAVDFVNYGFTTYSDGTTESDVDYVNGAPATGPVQVRTTAAPSDTLTANVVIDLDSEFNFGTVVTTIANADANDRYAEFYDSSQPTKYIRIYWFSSTLLAVSVFNGTSTAVSAVSADLTNGVNNILGVKMTGLSGAKVFAACANNIVDATPATIDMSGMTLDRMVIGSRVGGTTLMDMDIYSMTSDQLGDANFVGHLWEENDPEGNTFTTTKGVVITLDDQIEYGAVFPYSAVAKWPVAFLVSNTDSISPEVGDIYIDGDLVGNRDATTLVFTPDALFPAVELVSDSYQIGNSCVIVEAGGEVPPSFSGLDFSYSSNSQYIPLI